MLSPKTQTNLHVVKPEKLDAISVCRPLEMEICSGDRLQLKANATGVTGAKFANGEIVTVAKIKRTGEIALADGCTLPPSYPTIPTCWHREAPTSCLRIEIPDGTVRLFP